MAKAATVLSGAYDPEDWVRLDQINIRRSIELSPRSFGTYQGGRGALVTEYVRDEKCIWRDTWEQLKMPAPPFATTRRAASYCAS